MMHGIAVLRQVAVPAENVKPETLQSSALKDNALW
jgi:hypothetical protein